MNRASDDQAPRPRRRLLIAFGSLLALVALAEAALRWTPVANLPDPATIAAFATQATEQAGELRVDDQLGHAPVLDGPVYDKFGLLRRWGTRGSVAERREGVTRILLLGDDVTRRATLAVPLRALWRTGEVEFLNAGVAGWNPVQQVESYFRHQRQLAADQVVLWLHNDDLSETTVACLQGEQFTLCSPGNLVALDPEWYQDSALYRLWATRGYVDRSVPARYTDRAAEVEAALLRLRDEVHGRGARLTVVVLPILAAPTRWQDHERRARELVLALLRRLDCATVDLQPVCDELAGLGLPLRADSPAIDGPAPALAARMALTVAERLLPVPPVWCTAEPGVVQPAANQTLQIDAGADFAGRRFLVLGSQLGIVPATDLPRGFVTLADDAYLRRLSSHDAPPLSGVLDAEGRAAIAVPVPEGATPGSIVWHLAVVADRRGIHYERVGWPLPMIVPGPAK